MKIPTDYNSPLENTIRKVMFMQLLGTADGMLQGEQHAASPASITMALEKNGVNGLVVKGSGEYCLSDARPPIGRNPRDLDLIVMGTPSDEGYRLRRNLVYHLIEQAAEANGMGFRPAHAGELNTHETLTGAFFAKGKGVLSLLPSRQWIEDVLQNRSRYRLTEGDVNALESAKHIAMLPMVVAKIDIALDQPQQDMPPLDPKGGKLTKGIGVQDPRVSLLNKLGAVNSSLREEEFDSMVHAADMADIYNLYARMEHRPGGRGLAEKELAAIEQIIKKGPVYSQRQRLTKWKTAVVHLGHARFRDLGVSHLFSDRETPHVALPTPADAERLHHGLEEAHRANLITDPVPREQCEEILQLIYTLTQQVLGQERGQYAPQLK